jgi:hypothetical protein
LEGAASNDRRTDLDRQFRPQFRSSDRPRRIPDALSLSIAERRRRGIAMEGYWGRQSTNTRDRATAMMPRMLYDRLDELGIDFGIIYPTAGLGIARIEDDETRRAVVRGFNFVTADYFRDLSVSPSTTSAISPTPAMR